LNEKWRKHFTSLLTIIIQKFDADPLKLSIEIMNSKDHMLGNHSKCDDSYCNENHQFEKVDISENAAVDLTNYLQRISKRANKIRAFTTSNLAESYFSVNCKFQAGKIKKKNLNGMKIF